MPNDIPDEPMTITNLLLVHRMGLEQIVEKLYSKGSEDEETIGTILEDVCASIDVARAMCRKKKL